MRRSGVSILAGVVVVLLLAAALYYFYGYRDRAISADFSAVKESTADAATTTAVKTVLALSARVSAFNINVDTNKNVVTLTGQVKTEDDKRVAGELAQGTKGVAEVMNNLEVTEPVEPLAAERQRVTDLEIHKNLLEALFNHPELKALPIKTEVSNGTVKLSGSVQSLEQRTQVESIVRGVPKVQNVDLGALIVNPATPGAQTSAQAQAGEDAKLAAQVESAFVAEKAFAEPQKIQVRVEAGIVYLSGTVSSRAEKALAGNLARNVAGTKDVINTIEITAKR